MYAGSISYTLEDLDSDKMFPFLSSLVEIAMNLSSTYVKTVFLPVLRVGAIVLLILQIPFPLPSVNSAEFLDSIIDSLLAKSFKIGKLPFNLCLILSLEYDSETSILLKPLMSFSYIFWFLFMLLIASSTINFSTLLLI